MVNTLTILQRPGFFFVSLCTLYNSTVFLVLDVYFLEIRCIYKEFAELEAKNIFIGVLFELNELHVGNYFLRY